MLWQSCCQPHNEPGVIYIKISVQNGEGGGRGGGGGGGGVLVRKCSKSRTVQNSLDNMDTGMPLTQDCPAPLIDSTTEHYNNTATYISSLWLACTARESFDCLAFNGMTMHCHAYTKSFRSRDTSLLRTPQMAPMVSALNRFHCINFSIDTVATLVLP